MGGIFSEDNDKDNYVDDNLTTDQILDNIKNLLNNKTSEFSPSTLNTVDFDNVKLNQDDMEGGHQRRRRYLELESEINRIAQQGGNPKFNPIQIDNFDQIRDYLKNYVRQKEDGNEPTAPEAPITTPSEPAPAPAVDSVEPVTEGTFANVSMNTPVTEPQQNISNILAKVQTNLHQSGGADYDFDEEYDDEEYSDEDEYENDYENNYDQYSDTSYRKSDIQILPFYSESSTEDYSFQQPFISNRFN